MKLARAHLLVVLLTSLTASCLSVNWTRGRESLEIEESQLELLPEDAGLGDCLELFGAPLLVWEDYDRGVAIAYGWSDRRDLGGRLSLPVTDSYSASFQYNNIGDSRYGLAFFFDRSWRLRYWRYGHLLTLVPGDPSRDKSRGPRRAVLGRGTRGS